MKKYYAILVCGVFVGFQSGVACATDAFNLVGSGPISQGMGGVGAAFNIGPQGMMQNPATLTQMREGRYLGLGVDIVSADLEVKNTGTGETASSHSHGRNNWPYIGPDLSFVWRADRYAFGVGAFASEGVGTQ